MSLGFEAFDPLFEPGPASVPGYLVLLNLGDESPAIIAQLRGAIEASGDRLEPLLEKMLHTLNWRVQIVAATAMLAAGTTACVPALWRALDGPCWTSPQLAAIASRLDPDFLANARIRLEQGAEVDLGPIRNMSLLERHSALGPAVDPAPPNWRVRWRRFARTKATPPFGWTPF